MRYNYKKALDKLIEWAKKEGFYEILFNEKTSLIDWEPDSLNIPKKIQIENKYSNEDKVYIFLHELGHHQLRKDWTKFRKTLPVVAHAEQVSENKYKRRITYIISSIEEEYKAWEEGYKLGVRLGIKINEKNWNRIKSKSLFTYIKYYGTT